jgi:hypothetical protein
MGPTTRPADEPGSHCQAVSVQSKEALSNRSDAMDVEAGHSQPPEKLSLKGGRFWRPFPCVIMLSRSRREAISGKILKTGLDEVPVKGERPLHTALPHYNK